MAIDETIFIYMDVVTKPLPNFQSGPCCVRVCVRRACVTYTDRRLFLYLIPQFKSDNEMRNWCQN